MSLTDADFAAALAPAGLRFVERAQDEVRNPIPAGKSAASCSREDGRFDCRPDEIVEVNDPDLPSKVNAGWWRMATEFGLFNDRREFLLAVDYRDPAAIDPEMGWVRVRLLDEWDIAGSGVPALASWFAGLFTERLVPEFTMVSLDGRTLMNTTVWGSGTVSSIVISVPRGPLNGGARFRPGIELQSEC